MSNTLGDDLVPGVKRIAAYIGKTERQTYHLLETGQLPGFKLGNMWHIRKSTTLAHFEGLERAANQNEGEEFDDTKRKAAQRCSAGRPYR
jgi:hypothetical protein